MSSTEYRSLPGDDSGELNRPHVPAGNPDEIARARVAAKLGLQPEEVQLYKEHPNWTPDLDEPEDLSEMAHADDSPEMREVEDLLRAYATENLSSLRKPSEIAYPVIIPVAGESVVIEESAPALTEETGLFHPVASRRGNFRPAPTTRIADGTDALPVGKHRVPEGKVYRSRTARRVRVRSWLASLTRKQKTVLTMALAAGLLVLPSLGYAAWNIFWDKTIEGTASIAAPMSGVKWVPVNSSQAGVDDSGMGAQCLAQISGVGETLTLKVGTDQGKAYPGSSCRFYPKSGEQGMAVIGLEIPNQGAPDLKIVEITSGTPNVVLSLADAPGFTRIGDRIATPNATGVAAVQLAIVASVPSNATAGLATFANAHLTLVPYDATQGS